MNSTIFMWESIGAIMIFLIGAIIHFGYEITDKFTPLSGIFAVNESIWEHCKLTFWAPLIFALIEYFFIGHYANNFLVAKVASAFVTTIAMVILYYSWLNLFHKHSFIADLIIFEISILIGLFISYNLMLMEPLPDLLNTVSIFALICATFLFYFFTYYPPHLPIFHCSSTGKYGLND
ncbi:MAG: DUF6512 family protein [Clostridium sp.]|uniref:DUF6512 family protein n=1 Tax=Clostridium sp. TaxID=1506 RepID=UPI003065AA0F